MMPQANVPWLRRLRGDDRGVAMAMVLVIGAVLVLLSTVMITRGFRQLGNTSGNMNWDQSLSVAESGLEVGLVALDADLDYTTGEVMPSNVLGTDAEREWAVEAADAKAADDVEPTPEGEYVVIKPSNQDVLFAVGFVPGRDAAERRVRVVRATLSADSGGYQFTKAFLTDDDLDISGNPSFHGAAASAHANGHLSVSGNPSFHDGCLTASDGGTIGGNVNEHSECPDDPYDQPEVLVPDVVARDFWDMSEYDMCPDGKVRAGPAHPTFGSTAGLAPCSTGHILESDASDGYRGWEFDGCCDDSEWAEWDYSDKDKFDGAYYFHWGTAEISGDPGTQKAPWKVMIIAEAKESCPQAAGGDLMLSGNAVVSPYTAGTAHDDNKVVVVADRDVEWSGNGRLADPGIVAAREQIKLNGNPQIDGSFIAQSECDSPESNVHDTQISGNPKFTLEGPLEVEWPGTGPPVLAVVGWDEL